MKSSTRIIRLIQEAQDLTDNDIALVYDALKLKRREVGAVTSAIVMMKIQVGQTIRFVKTVRPTYLAGVKAKVVEKGHAWLVVEILDKNEAGRFEGMVRVPPELVEAT